MPGSSAPREIELKLAVDARDLPRLKRHALLQGVGPARTLVSTYFDTAGLDLRKAGLTLRVRRDGDGRIQTIKRAGGPAAGLLAREEWETPVAGDRPTAASLAGTPVEAVLKPGGARRLRPLFTIRVERASRLLDLDGAEIELALDLGRVEAKGRGAPLIELELELKRGVPGQLFDAADRIFDGAPPRLSFGSKYDAAFALLRPAAGPVKATPPPLVRDMSSAEAFQAIARSCLAHYVGNEPAARRGAGPSELHQARVALRRLRAAMSLFRRMLNDAESDALRAELRRVAAGLGEGRDLDVLAGQLREGPHPAALVRAVEQRRRAAYRSIREMLEAPEAARLPFRLAAWIEAGAWLEAGGRKRAALRERPIEAFAAETLHKRRAGVEAGAGRLHKLKAEPRHALRIEVKKLRYAAEFFEPLASGAKDARRAERFLDALRPLQDGLGELNDIAAHQALAESFGPELAKLLPARDAEEKALLKTAEKAAARLAKVKDWL